MATEKLIELKTDVSHSSLYNADLAPTTLEERNWSTYNFLLYGLVWRIVFQPICFQVD